MFARVKPARGDGVEVVVFLNSGKNVRRLGAGFGLEGEEGEITAPKCASANGFSLHANVFIDRGNRDKLERLIKYTSRPPHKEESLSQEIWVAEQQAFKRPKFGLRIKEQALSFVSRAWPI